MKAKSSLLLKTVCVILFVLLTITTLWGVLSLGAAWSAGAVGAAENFEQAKRDLYRSVVTGRERYRLQRLCDTYLHDGDYDALLNSLSAYRPDRTNVRLCVKTDDGAVLFDTIDANTLTVDEITVDRAIYVPVNAREAGFSEEETLPQLQWITFMSREEAENYLSIQRMGPEHQEILEYTIEPLSQSGHSYDSGTHLLLYRLADETDGDDVSVLSDWIGSHADENFVSKLFDSRSDAEAYIGEIRARYRNAQVNWDPLPDGRCYVRATLLAEKLFSLPVTVGFDRLLPVHDLTAFLVRAIDFAVDRQVAVGWITALSALSALGCLIFLIAAAGHKRGVEGIRRNWIDHIPFDLYLGLLVPVFLLTMLPVANFSYYYRISANPALDDLALVGSGIVFLGLPIVAWLLLGLSVILTTATRIKARTLFQNTVIGWVVRHIGRFLKWLFGGIAYALKNLPLYWKTALVWGGLGILTLILLSAFAYNPSALGTLWVLAMLLLTPIVVFSAINLRKLEKGGEQLAAGNLDYRVDTRRMLPSFRRHGEHLNSITEGMQRAVREQMKSERLKTELITNVSHDIKTPLTAIISYIKLLERDGLQSEKAPEYLEVLDRQSARLKKLTDDLVEASKASSGTMSVNPERTDLNVLLLQAMGEFNEKLEAARLTMVQQLSEPAPIVTADGRLLWRVFDNLFSNLVKYAQPDTRVYLSTATEGRFAVVTLKNISRDALNISGDELMERFVRGDASRNTEGSGLGLSIAKSLMLLQNGDVVIDIDGDLFKVSVSIPLAK